MFVVVLWPILLALASADEKDYSQKHMRKRFENCATHKIEDPKYKENGYWYPVPKSDCTMECKKFTSDNPVLIRYAKIADGGRFPSEESCKKMCENVAVYLDKIGGSPAPTPECQIYCGREELVRLSSLRGKSALHNDTALIYDVLHTCRSNDQCESDAHCEHFEGHAGYCCKKAPRNVIGLCHKDSFDPLWCATQLAEICEPNVYSGECRNLFGEFNEDMTKVPLLREAVCAKNAKSDVCNELIKWESQGFYYGIFGFTTIHQEFATQLCGSGGVYSYKGLNSVPDCNSLSDCKTKEVNNHFCLHLGNVEEMKKNGNEVGICCKKTNKSDSCDEQKVKPGKEPIKGGWMRFYKKNSRATEYLFKGGAEANPESVEKNCESDKVMCADVTSQRCRASILSECKNEMTIECEHRIAYYSFFDRDDVEKKFDCKTKNKENLVCKKIEEMYKARSKKQKAVQLLDKIQEWCNYTAQEVKSSGRANLTFLCQEYEEKCFNNELGANPICSFFHNKWCRDQGVGWKFRCSMLFRDCPTCKDKNDKKIDFYKRCVENLKDEARCTNLKEAEDYHKQKINQLFTYLIIFYAGVACVVIERIYKITISFLS